MEMASETGADTERLSYRDAGVDIDAGNAFIGAIRDDAKSTGRSGVMGGLGGFGGLFDLRAAGFDDPVLVAATDGVGTKLMLAAESRQHQTVGIDLVAMCANDLIVQGAEPLFFLDYIATGRLRIDAMADVVAGIAEGCRQAGCALIGGETAEMPGLYGEGHYDLAGFCVGAVERGQQLDGAGIAAGDVVLGLASSGVHSNGYALVRRIVAMSGLALDEPAPFSPDHSLATALLTPTRLYVSPCLAAIRAGGVKGLAHITGGGLIENIPRILPDGLGVHLLANNWAVPSVFGWLARTGGVPTPEMARTFNCGIGMVLIVSPDATEDCIALVEQGGETVSRIGVVDIIEDDTPVVIDGLEDAWSP